MSRRNLRSLTTQEKPKFDPIAKSYQWDGNEEFVIKGGELHFFNQVVDIILNTPEGNRIKAALKAKELINNILSEAYEDGLVREVPNAQLQSLAKEKELSDNGQAEVMKANDEIIEPE
jgi:hypothetical protein